MMLRITVDLVPHGEEHLARPIGKMVIANDGTGNDQFANYVFAMLDNHDGVDCGTLKDHYRNAGFWDLIVDCIIRGNYENHELVPTLLEKLGDEL